MCNANVLFVNSSCFKAASEKNLNGVCLNHVLAFYRNQNMKLVPLPLLPQLVASIVFISFGVVAAFCCAIVDGVFAARHIVSITKAHSTNPVNLDQS